MDQRIATGRLMVATPRLNDSEFRLAVVFIVTHETDGGTLGVIVNRPSELEVGAVLGGWAGFASDPGVMFSGGPVGAGSGLALGRAHEDAAPLGWRPISPGGDALDRIGVVDLDTPPELIGDALGRLRVFAGYTGWSGGQLDEEIEEGSWYVLPAEADDVFSHEPERLWPRVLRRQGGDLALVSTYPDDPALN
jgi:putative transcriptional regulator